MSGTGGASSLLVGLALAVTVATAGPAPSAPGRLSETGIADAAVRPYSPQYPLWSDGAVKRNNFV